MIIQLMFVSIFPFKPYYSHRKKKLRVCVRERGGGGGITANQCVCEREIQRITANQKQYNYYV